MLSFNLVNSSVYIWEMTLILETRTCLHFFSWSRHMIASGVEVSYSLVFFFWAILKESLRSLIKKVLTYTGYLKNWILKQWFSDVKSFVLWPRSALEGNLQIYAKKSKIFLSWELCGSGKCSEMKGLDWKRASGECESNWRPDTRFLNYMGL